MPFISVYGLIPITEVVPGGAGLTLDLTPGDESYVYSGLSTDIGTLVNSYDPGAAIQFYKVSDGSSLGYIPIASLPADFSIVSILTTLVPGDSFAFAIPMEGGLFTKPNTTITACSTPTWDGLPLSWDPSYTDELLDPFTMDIQMQGVGIITPRTGRYPIEINAVNFQTEVYFPTNCLIFQAVGTFEGIVLGPVTNPELGPGPSITVTPPPGAETVIVEVPGEPPIVEPVTPGTPITIPLPPGSTVVTITPSGGGGAGPPVIVPIDINVSAEGIPIDLSIAAVMQVIGDPSGIYTLVPGKRHDTLYERNAGMLTTQNVAIPEPFGKTAYFPEDD